MTQLGSLVRCHRNRRLLLDINLFQSRLPFAIVAMSVVEDRSQNPILRCHVPIGPGIAADMIRSAFTAYNVNFRVFLRIGHPGIMRGQRE